MNFSSLFHCAISGWLPRLYMLHSIALLCTEQRGPLLPDDSFPLLYLLDKVFTPSHLVEIFDLKAFGLYTLWYAYCLATWFVLPGSWVDLPGGRPKMYKVNGPSTFGLTLAIAVVWISCAGYESFTFIYRQSIGLMVAAFVFSVLQGLLLYGLSFLNKNDLVLDAITGSALYGFVVGRQFNPTIGSLDIRTFNGSRPGIILWLLVDISMLCEQAARRGGQLTPSMILLVLAQSWHIFEALWHESTVIDRPSSRGLGFLAIFEDLFWVPFMSSMQARYLVFNQRDLGSLPTILFVLAMSAGTEIFHASNNQQNAFERGPPSRDTQYMEMSNGDTRLVSGWWRLCRNPNYLGEILVVLSWSLLTGFDTLLTYSYFLCYALDLIDRQRRADDDGKERYGEEWRVYTAHVRSRIVPYVY